ncbi:MAG: DUF3781 domain-containing protein, partial [Treponema sp.]|nr:DUF3781 domain-containing protein [Treponema sp.]
MTDCKELLSNIEKIHTTEMGEERIRRNLSLGKEILDTVGWCKEQIGLPEARRLHWNPARQKQSHFNCLQRNWLSSEQTAAGHWKKATSY